MNSRPTISSSSSSSSNRQDFQISLAPSFLCLRFEFCCMQIYQLFLLIYLYLHAISFHSLQQPVWMFRTSSVQWRCEQVLSVAFIENQPLQFQTQSVCICHRLSVLYMCIVFTKLHHCCKYTSRTYRFMAFAICIHDGYSIV